MTDELRQEIELLKAQVAALTDERLPKVDRASRRRDRRQVIGGFGMFAIALLMAGTLSASALAGQNTVTTDDIVAEHVRNSDIGSNSVSGSKVYPDTLTGADINESSLNLAGTSGYERVEGSTHSFPTGSPTASIGSDVDCPTGKVAVGGAWEQGGQALDPITVFTSRPTTDGSTWDFGFRYQQSNLPNTTTVTFYAICVNGP